MVGSWSLVRGLVHNGGDKGSCCVAGGVKGAGVFAGDFEITGVEDIMEATGTAVVTAVVIVTELGGGVCGDRSSSDDLSGLPNPDSL